MAEVQESKDIPGVWLVRLQSFGDLRGRFMETYCASWLPFAAPMVQGNRSESAPRVLRGLHYHRKQADFWYVQSARSPPCSWTPGSAPHRGPAHHHPAGRR